VSPGFTNVKENERKAGVGRVYMEYGTCVGLKASQRHTPRGAEGYTQEREGRNYNNNDGERPKQRDEMKNEITASPPIQ
jgi:hypothetical protein